MKQKKAIGGFDFLKLTKSQWAHLRLIEREHGIPWHIYIRDLIKADMEGRLLSPDVRERRVKLKADITPKSLERTLARIEEILSRPQQVVYAQGPPMPGAPLPPPSNIPRAPLPEKIFKGSLVNLELLLDVKTKSLNRKKYKQDEYGQLVITEAGEWVLTDEPYLSEEEQKQFTEEIGKIQKQIDKLTESPELYKKIDIQFPDHVNVEKETEIKLQPASEGQREGKKNEGKGVETVGD